MKKYGVLFVCTGNICRSSTAEGVFRHYVIKNGEEERFFYDSAGTHGYHVGEPPDSRATATALARGIEMHDLRARRFKKQDFDEFDLILAMDEGHYDILESMAPSNGNASLSLFMDYASGMDRSDVPDPYYGSQNDFEYALDLIENGIQGLLKHLK